MTAPRVLVIEDPSAEYLRALDALRTETTIIVSNHLEALLEEAPRADVILTGYLKVYLLPAIFPKAIRARWVHFLHAGVEKVLFPELIASPVVFTNARRAYKRQLARFRHGGSAVFRQGPSAHDQKSGSRFVWAPFDPEDVEGKVMVIVGYGEIGRACAQRAWLFGMRILCLRRRPDLFLGDTLPEKIFGPNGLQEMLSACDYVLLAAPNTVATRHLIGKAEIASMKPGAVLINVGRGLLVDEEALALALEQHRIRARRSMSLRPNRCPQVTLFTG